MDRVFVVALGRVEGFPPRSRENVLVPLVPRTEHDLAWKSGKRKNREQKNTELRNVKPWRWNVRKSRPLSTETLSQGRTGEISSWIEEVTDGSQDLCFFLLACTAMGSVPRCPDLCTTLLGLISWEFARKREACNCLRGNGLREFEIFLLSFFLHRAES